MPQILGILFWTLVLRSAGFVQRYRDRLLRVFDLSFASSRL